MNCHHQNPLLNLAVCSKITSFELNVKDAISKMIFSEIASLQSPYCNRFNKNERKKDANWTISMNETELRIQIDWFSLFKSAAIILNAFAIGGLNEDQLPGDSLSECQFVVKSIIALWNCATFSLLMNKIIIIVLFQFNWFRTERKKI